MSAQPNKIKGTTWAILAALLSGVLLALCFPGWNISGLVWVWMLPLFPAIWRGERKRYGFTIGYLAGLAFWLLNLKWLGEIDQYHIAPTVLAAFLALYFGLWGAMAVSIGNPWRKGKAGQKNTDANIDAKGGNIAQKIAQKQVGQKNKGLFGGALSGSIRSLKFAFINAAAWVGFEWLRGWLFTGFGWNGLGVAFHDTLVLAQAADLVGVAGLAFLPVFMSAVMIQSGQRLMAEAATGKLKPRLDFSVAAMLLALHFCYGVWRVRDVGSWKTERVRVLLVQENIPQDIKWDPRAVADIFQGYSTSTQKAIQAIEDENVQLLQENIGGDAVELKQPDLVIWPESAFPTPLLFGDDIEGHLLYGEAHHLINEEIRPLGKFTLVAGMNEFEASIDGERAIMKEGGGQYNSIAAVAPGGELEQSIQTYRKMHLVIFGEYIPLVDQLPFLGDIFAFSSGSDFSGNFDAGVSTEPLVVAVGDAEVQLIPSVCFEDTVGRLTRKFVRREPQVIINVTNDGWFKQSEGAAQHMANAKFRAIELRRPMVRSANTGVSGIISATGSVVDPVTGKRQVVEDENGNHFVKSSLYGHAYAPVHGPMTLYAILGDWFSYTMIFIVVIAVIKSRFARI